MKVEQLRTDMLIRGPSGVVYRVRHVGTTRVSVASPYTHGVVRSGEPIGNRETILDETALEGFEEVPVPLAYAELPNELGTLHPSTLREDLPRYPRDEDITTREAFGS